MDQAYGARYRELFERHWWWRARERVILRALSRHEPARGWRSALDIGCGDGLFFDELARLPGMQLLEGVEPSAALVSSHGPHRGRIHVRQFDTDFDPGRRYSLVLMLDVLEHLPDPAASLHHALSLLEAGGVIVVTVPAFMALWTRHDDLNHHYRRYTRSSFRALAAEAGMRIDRLRYFFHWTAAAKIATRVKEAIIPGRPAPPSVPPAAVNGTLYALSRIEHVVLGALPVPFGSSLLAVGRRDE